MLDFSIGESLKSELDDENTSGTPSEAEDVDDEILPLVRSGAKPDLDYLLYCAKNAERLLRPTIPWSFCAKCKSAFFNNEIFRAHLPHCSRHD